MEADAAEEAFGEGTEQVGDRRKSRLKPGRTVCWFLGCGQCIGLKSVPPSRVADARYCLELFHDYDPTGGEPGATPRLLPIKNNKSCPRHYPETLPEQQIIGAKVLIPLDGRLAEGEVIGPKASTRRTAAGAALSAAALLRGQRWQVKEKDGDAVHEMTTADVWRQAALLKANAETLAKGTAGYAQKIKNLQTVLARERAKARAADEPQPQPPTTPPPAGRSPRAGNIASRESRAAPPIRRHVVEIRVRVRTCGIRTTACLTATLSAHTCGRAVHRSPSGGLLGIRSRSRCQPISCRARTRRPSHGRRLMGCSSGSGCG